MAWKVLLLPLLVGLVAGSGCATKAPAAPTIVVEHSPNEHNMTLRADQLPHYHDYWGGKDTYDVLAKDETAVVGLALTPADTPIPVLEFRPDPNHIVPQGASLVRITLNWTNDALDQYASPELWVKNAAQRDALKVADLKTGQTVTVESTNDGDDLPHQVLSSWEFWVYAHATDQGVLRYNAHVHMDVKAVRGLPIPLYPGHPDHWGDRTHIRLFAYGPATTVFQGTSEEPNICLSGCPITLTPQNGTIVPPDADHVTVWFNFTYGTPSKLGLRYHGADTFDWTVPPVASEAATGPNVVQRVYNIPVGYTGDGPYAKQSQWQFEPFIESPDRDGAVVEDLQVSAVAYEHP